MTRSLSYAEAIREALSEAMREDSRVIVLGQGVDDAGGIFGSTRGLHQEFGPDRSFDTPLAEEAMTGLAGGLAMSGFRPVLVHARVEFALLALNQLLTHLAKWGDMYGPESAMPVVIRAVIGKGWGQGAQHSQALVPLFGHVPGIQVIAPTTPADASGLMASALEARQPVVILEHRQHYGMVGQVPRGRIRVPIGSARIARSGRDVTIVAYSQMVDTALEASFELERHGIEAEIIDLRSLVPLDLETVARSVEKTGRLVVAEYGWTRFGVGAEIASRLLEAGGAPLAAPLVRVGFPDRATPSSPVLEAAYYPDANSILSQTLELFDLNPRRRALGNVFGLQESW